MRNGFSGGRTVRLGLRGRDGPLSCFGLGFRHGCGVVQFLDDLHNPIAPDNGVVYEKSERGGVTEDHGLGHESLQARTMFGEQLQPAFLLISAAENANEDDGGFEISGAVNVVDGDEAGFANVEFTTDGFANGALEQLADSLLAKVGHQVGKYTKVTIRICSSHNLAATFSIV